VATELRPGVMTAIFGRLAIEGNSRSRLALEPLALVIEKQAKINASSGAHTYGTPTPAYPGTGPAVISGALRRAITHSPIAAFAGGWETSVGTGIGSYPPYGGSNRQPANKYGYFLEVEGLRNGAKYPFLEPAFKFGIGVPATLIYNEIYGRTWTRVA
jgi:hypothetical protein